MMCTDSSALCVRRFGAFPHDYDLSKIGRYAEVLSLGDNMDVFRKINLHVPLGGANARAFAEKQKVLQTRGKIKEPSAKILTKALAGSMKQLAGMTGIRTEGNGDFKSPLQNVGGGLA